MPANPLDKFNKDFDKYLDKYFDSLILKIRQNEALQGAVFYRAFDGKPIAAANGFSVCVGSGRLIREKRYLSLYKARRRTCRTAELELKVSAPNGNGLCVFCERLEALLSTADQNAFVKSEISAPKYDEDFIAVYRTIKFTFKIYDDMRGDQA